jgi:hypothetical protein
MWNPPASVDHHDRRDDTNVRGLRPGDEVLGSCRAAFAEYARVMT